MGGLQAGSGSGSGLEGQVQMQGLVCNQRHEVHGNFDDPRVAKGWLNGCRGDQESGTR